MEINKIWGVGLGKTGTSTLEVVLQRMGFRTLDLDEWETSKFIIDNVARGIYTFKTMENYDALTNACRYYYQCVDRHYPNSKFILTLREKESWLDSWEKHFNWWYKQKDVDESVILSVHNHFAMFGCYFFSRERFGDVYDMHHKNVRDYFAGRYNDCIEVDWTQEKDLSRLCNFLGREVSDLSIPWVNKAEDRDKEYVTL
jgi:hypothetical protein